MKRIDLPKGGERKMSDFEQSGNLGKENNSENETQNKSKTDIAEINKLLER